MLDVCRKNDVIIVVTLIVTGDLNAKVGSDNSGYENGEMKMGKDCVILVN